MKVALIQLCAGTDKQANILQALSMSAEALAKGAQLVLLPEIFNFRGDLRNKEALAREAEKIPGPSSSVFIPLAKKYEAALVLGSIIEKAGSTHAYNTSVFIDPRGNIKTKYRKIHLFDARIGDKIIKETECFRAGRSGRLVNAQGFKMGLSICYDLRFSKIYQAYARGKADIITVPSCFTRKTGQAHWEVLLRARAIENLAYVLAPNQVGTDHRGIQAHGHSMIISPWGEIVAQASGEKQEILFGQIDHREIERARKTLPGIIN